MKIALITTDEFTDYELLKLKLDELKVCEIICGNTVGYKLVEQYQSEHDEVLISQGDGELAYKAYDAIKKADTVAIFTNGTGHLNNSRTNLAIRNALKNKKKLYIYPYKVDAFEIVKEDKYIKLDFKKSVKQAFNTNGIYLNKDEARKMIEQLETMIND